MTRENQGLHVALILFASLVVILAVATFLFFSHAEEADARAKASQEETTRNLAAMRTMQQEVHEMKRLIGLPVTAELATIRTTHAEDMARHVPGFPEDRQFYRPALLCLDNVIRSRNDELAVCKREIQELSNQYERLEPSTLAQVQQHRSGAAEAGKDLLGVQAEARRLGDRIRKDNDAMHETLVRTRQEAAEAMAVAERRFRTIQDKYRKVVLERDALRGRLDELANGRFASPHGTIRNIDYRLRRAWIDLGRADGLPQRLDFDVYSPQTHTLGPSAKKGEVRVTRVLEDHLAETRLTSEEISDPILIGDVVHAPGWTRSDP